MHGTLMKTATTLMPGTDGDFTAAKRLYLYTWVITPGFPGEELFFRQIPDGRQNAT